MSFSVIFVLRVVFRGGFGNDFSFHELLLWTVERSYVYWHVLYGSLGVTFRLPCR